MLFQIKTINGQKKIIPLTADAGAGAPVGTVIVVCSNQIPSNYLPLGTQYDTSLYPVLYALLGTDTTPTASALGLPTLTSGQYAIKATSGLSENAQDNVINTLNEQRSYSTEEHLTGKKWIDGKPIYRKTFYPTTQNLLLQQWGFCGFANTIMSNVDSLIFATAHAIAFNRLCYYTTILARPDLGFYSGAINIDAGSAITIEYTKTN